MAEARADGRLKFGISLLRVHPARWRDVAVAAEDLGFESVWISDHLVLPVDLVDQDDPTRKLPINPHTPVFDALGYLAWLAGLTERIRLGTYVYLLGLRHPFVTARAIATLDQVSAGRVELGVGAGYIKAEFDAAGLPFAERGRLLDDAIATCRRLWTEEEIDQPEGRWTFPPIVFDPKPVQQRLPVHIGGESPAALRRAVAIGDGWIGRHHGPESAAQAVEQVCRAARRAGREPSSLAMTVAAQPGPITDLAAWRQAGIDRLICAPWTRSSTALEGMREFACTHGLNP